MRITKENIVPLVLATILLLVSLTAGGAFGYILSELHNMTGIENLKAFQPSIPTRLYDVHGELIAELFEEKRDLVSYEDLPRPVIHAFLAAEDKDFYDHFGINPMAIVRAMIKNIEASISAGEIVVVQGGSTITQQLAKRLFTEGERTLARKAVEAVIALQIESRFSKEEILEMYFNQIYLGHGCHGIATAARFFFDKNVRHLNAAEASVLAALPSKPNGYSPLRYPRTAFEKNKDTVRRMKEAGFITDEQAERIFTEFWPGFIDSLKTEFPTKTALTRNVDRAPYFTDYIRQILISRFGEERVYTEGMQVYTTLDLKRQEYAEKYLKQGLTRQEEISTKANAYYRSALDRGLFGAYSTLRMIFNLPGVIIRNDLETKFKKLMVDEFTDSLDILSLLSGVEGPGEAFQTFRDLTSTISSSMKVEGALIAVEPTTGYITSMVGGSEFQVSNQFNRAVQARRQPGSAFKPFVYGAALEAGKITTATNLPDVPIVDIDAQGDTWAPGNYEGDYRGMVPVYFALPASINIISVRIYDLVGPDVIIDYASRMLNVPVSRFNPNPTLALGTTEVTPFEMATAYSIYANRGRDVIPFAIRYIVDRDGNKILSQEETVGRIIAQKELKNQIQVIPESVAWIMTDLMRGVIDRGTANDAIRNKGGFRKQAAGKTGTTSNWTDAWFCGFTPDLTCVVWVGYDRQFMSLGKHQAGASVAAPIWANYMKKVYNGMPDPSFSPPPSGVYTYGRGYGIRGARTQYYQTTDEEGNKLEMKTVLDRYLEKEGLKAEE
jgi:penicillin-binding protein 1A